MSRTFTLQGNSNILEADFCPPIDISDGPYDMALISLSTYNTIPNIEGGENKFYYDGGKVITIPMGSYEIDDIEKYLQTELKKIYGEKIKLENDEEFLLLRANTNTMQTELKCKFNVDLGKQDSIAKILGFSKSKILKANEWHTSDSEISIIKVASIRVECNIIQGAYYDGEQSHTIYEFTPQVPPGYKIIIEPSHIIYLPVSSSNSFSNITLALVDQNRKPINLRGETTIIRLELKKRNGPSLQ